MKDTIVESVIEQFKERSNVGIKKYGVTLDREDLDRIQWLQHLQEELMDATLYIQKLLDQEQEITMLVKNHPNDCELGMLIRNMVI